MVARRIAFVAWLAIACGERPAVLTASQTTGHRSADHDHVMAASSAEGAEVDRALDEVARVHGAPGPWAVLGYRMGRFALRKLALEPGSFDLEIEHRTPKKVQYSCIADGAQAATGASAGKLNLSLTDATEATVETLYRKRSTGQLVVLAPSESFRVKYTNAPRERARELGREVMLARDEELFDVRQ
jgi:formylmethanofuran dehydrogenase subunit E